LCKLSRQHRSHLLYGESLKSWKFIDVLKSSAEEQGIVYIQTEWIAKLSIYLGGPGFKTKAEDSLFL